MKNKSPLQTLRPTMLALTGILTLMSAAFALAADNKIPTPLPGNTQATIDPASGLPVPTSAPEWKDPEWTDPDKSLTVSYDGLPLEEVAVDLRKQFNEAFDIIIPKNSWQPVNSAPFDAGSVPIRIQLKNVTASELFNAINLMFEAENTPLRWELKMNGRRPLVLLRVLFVAPFPLGAQEPAKRKIFYVGDMVGDEKAGFMTMEQLVKTISEVYEMSYSTTQGSISDHVQFHKQAQLLIVTGSVDELGFVQETLLALRQKVERSREAAFTGAAGDGTKKIDDGGKDSRKALKADTNKPKAP